MSVRITLFMLIVLTANDSYSQANLAEPIIIPLNLTEEGHIVVRAAVNGVEGSFIFDTGAGLNVMTKTFADKISNLEKTEGFYTGFRATGEALQADLWITDTLSNGLLKSTKQAFAIIEAELPIDGIISLMPFKRIPFTIDYGNCQLPQKLDRYK